MLFSEVYGTYYNVLAKLLENAVDGTLTRESMNATFSVSASYLLLLFSSMIAYIL